MDKKDCAHFKKMLYKMRDDIHHTMETMKEHGVGNQDMSVSGELSNYDNHPAEMGTLLYEAEHNYALVVHQESLLREIDDALERIDKGTYGECTFCGKGISRERLEALPYAELCMDCAEHKASDAGIMARKPPSEEEELGVKQYFHEFADDEFEGMDYINDLVKYGSSDTPQDMGKNRDMKEFYTNEVDKQGIVDDMDQVTNDEYKRQLPD